jgi:TolB-like protein/tetratricopeptide (TPR) repeat protein
MAIKCPKCKADNPGTATFCADCGTQLPSLEDIEVTETMEAPKGELTTGSTFAGRYQIIEELGKGGMGRVYKVFDKEVNAKVALKLIKPEIASDKKTIERFRNELKVARDIAHKNVCRMYDLGKEEGAYYITMEYVSGEDLKSFIRRSELISTGKAISIAKQICEGLSEAHGVGIVHRDLKPSNIMIDKEGNVRIMDFGIARSLNGKALTEAGVIIGTPEYMSPEQVEGKETDHRSDIYSLGVILYEMLTGSPPFEGDTPLSIAVQHRSDTPKDPRDLNAQIPEDLSSVILRCLEKEKGARYQSAKELLSSLAQIEQGIPTAERTAPRTKPVTSKEITVRFTLRKLYIPAAVLLVLAAVAFVIFRKPSVKFDPNKVVVAIFENQTGDENLNDIGGVIASSISEALNQIDEITVIPMDTVLQISRMLDAEESGQSGIGQAIRLGRETEAGMVVAGNFSKLKDELRIVPEIIDTGTGNPAMSVQSSSGPFEDMVHIVDDLKDRVSGAIYAYFDAEVSYGDATFQTPPERFSAYQQYALGNELFDRDLGRAFEHYEQAIKLDSTFFAPYFPLMAGYGNAGNWEQVEYCINILDKNRENLSEYSVHHLEANKARFEEDPEGQFHHYFESRKISPENVVNNYLTGSYAYSTNRPKLAVEILRNPPVETYPSFFDEGWVGEAWFGSLIGSYHMLGQFKKELKAVRVAQSVYPDTFQDVEVRALSALGRINDVEAVIEKCRLVTREGFNLGRIMFEAALELRNHGHLESYRKIASQAVEWYSNRILEEDASSRIRLQAAEALYLAERWDEAQKSFEVLAEEFLDVFPTPTLLTQLDKITCKGYLGVIAARKGERETAQQISEELESIDYSHLSGRNTYWRARIASILNERDTAFNLLKKALGEGRRYGVDLHQNIDFEPLRDYKPFQDLLKPKG